MSGGKRFPIPGPPQRPLILEWGSHASEYMSMDRRFWVLLPEPLTQQSWWYRWVGPESAILITQFLLRITVEGDRVTSLGSIFLSRDPSAGVGVPALGGPLLFRGTCLHAHAWVTAPAPLPRTPACRSHPLTLLGLGTEGPGAPEPAQLNSKH